MKKVVVCDTKVSPTVCTGDASESKFYALVSKKGSANVLVRTNYCGKDDLWSFVRAGAQKNYKTGIATFAQAIDRAKKSGNTLYEFDTAAALYAAVADFAAKAA